MKIATAKSATPNYINEHKKRSQEELQKLSSGTKLRATDAAMMQIAKALMSDASVMAQGIQNANENIAMLQIADGALRGVSQIATRLEELEVRANSASLNEEQKRMLASEYSAQVKAIQQTISEASYNGTPLFGKSFSSSIGKSEITVTLPKLNSDTLALGNSDALEAFKKSLQDAASQIGSGINAYTSAIDSLLVTRTNTLAAYSQMADSDVAKSVSNLKEEQLLTQSTLFASAHAKQLDQERTAALLA